MKNGFIVTLALLLFACESDEPIEKIIEPPPQIQYFELTVDRDYPTSDSDNWIIIHDQNNTFINAKRFEAGQNLKFDTFPALPGELKITLMAAKTVANNKMIYKLQTFLNVNLNEKWNLKKPYSVNENPGTIQGILGVTVTSTNLGSSWDAIISNKQKKYIPTALDFQTFQFEEAEVGSNWDDYFVSALDKTGTPYYKYIENVSPGSLTLTLDDFEAFDLVKPFTFPVSYAAWLEVHASDNVQTRDEPGYFTQSYLSPVKEAKPVSSFKLGFLEKFSYYQVTFYAVYSDDIISFQSKGAFPEEIILPTLDTELADATFTNFSLSGESDFIRRISYWNLYSYAANIEWSVFGTNDPVANPGLPEIIEKNYPTLKLSELKHNATYLYEIGNSYENLLATEFKGEDADEENLFVIKGVH